MPSYICANKGLQPIGALVRDRLGNSGLNAHLCSYGLKESKNCECGFHTENPSHFYFTCPRIAAHRPDLLSALDLITND